MRLTQALSSGCSCSGAGSRVVALHTPIATRRHHRPRCARCGSASSLSDAHQFVSDVNLATVATDRGHATSQHPAQSPAAARNVDDAPQASTDDRNASAASDSARASIIAELAISDAEEAEAWGADTGEQGVAALAPEAAAAREFHAHVGEPALPPPTPQLPDARLGPGGGGSDAAWVWALAVVGALRLGRHESEAGRYFHRRKQLARYGPISVSRELTEKRRQYERSTAAQATAQSVERVAAAKERAAAAERVRREEQRRYAAAAEKEAAALRKQMEEQRQAYEEQERQLRAELAARVEVETRMQQEALAKQRAEEDARRREEEARRAALEEERRRREEAARLEREAAAQRKLEEKRALAQEKKRFALRLEGVACAERPSAGTMTEGRFPRPAAVTLAVRFGSLMGGEAEPREATFATLADAQAGAAEVAGGAAHDAADVYASAARLQAMTDEGPLAFLDEPEFSHWMATAAARAGAVAAGALADALARWPPPKGSDADEARLQVRCEWAALPAEHAASLPSRMGAAISLIEEGRGDEAWERVLAEVVEDEGAAFAEGISLPPPLRYVPLALVCAHLLDRMLATRPAKEAAAPAWFEAAAALVRAQLKEATRDEPKDSLGPLASLLSGALGAQHPVAAMAADVAARNMSPAARAAVEERRRLREAEEAARLLQEEWPDYRELAQARMEEAEAATPLPERVWALRNVAGTLAMGGPGERSRARSLLEQAAGLKQVYCGRPDHPGSFPEVLALYNVLAGGPGGDGGGGGAGGWADAAGEVARQLLKLAGVVADRYSAKGELASAVVLLEAAVRMLEDDAGSRSREADAVSKQAERLFDLLEPSQRQQVVERRTAPASKALSAVADAFTEQLAIYATPGDISRAEQWEEGGLAPLKLLL